MKRNNGKMKKAMAGVMATTMMLSLAACGNKETAEKRTSEISMPVFLNIRHLISGYDGMQDSSMEFIDELIKQETI